MAVIRPIVRDVTWMSHESHSGKWDKPEHGLACSLIIPWKLHTTYQPIQCRIAGCIPWDL